MRGAGRTASTGKRPPRDHRRACAGCGARSTLTTQHGGPGTRRGPEAGRAGGRRTRGAGCVLRCAPMPVLGSRAPTPPSRCCRCLVRVSTPSLTPVPLRSTLSAPSLPENPHSCDSRACVTPRPLAALSEGALPRCLSACPPACLPTCPWLCEGR